MNKIRNKISKLLASFAVSFLVVAFALVTPLTAVVGAVRVSAASVNSDLLTLTNIPARYAQVGDDVVAPSGTGIAATLYHAGLPYTKAKYEEVGQYEWRLTYNDGTAESPRQALYDTYTVFVSQPSYQIVMPSDVVTVAPKSVGTLSLPLPEKITADGEEITLGDDYQLVAHASMGTNKKTYTVAADATSVDIKLNELGDVSGTLQVTYELKQGTRSVAAQVLKDIEIKDIDVSKVTFATNPTAPSVTALAYWQSIQLTKPAMDNAKYKKDTKDISFAVESTTKIIEVNYYGYADQPDWKSNKVVKEDVTYTNGKYTSDIIEITEDLQVMVKKLGWYKFRFETTTLFGNVTDAKDDTDGKYWSDAVHINIDAEAGKPKLKLVKAYNDTTDITDYQNNFDDLDETKDFSRFAAMNSKPESSADAKKIKIKDSIVFPAVFARDNATAYADLTFSATITRLTDGNGNSVNINNTTDVKNYNPRNTLTVSFKDQSTLNNDDNNVEIKAGNGLYQITFSAVDKQPTYEDGKKNSNGWPLTGTRTMYFYVDDSYTTTVAPTIDAFAVSDVYLWQGHTFEVEVPTYEDANTTMANIDMNYYLVDKHEKKIAKVDASVVKNNRITIDLDNLKQQDGSKAVYTYTYVDPEDSKTYFNEFYLYAVARNFDALQTELKGTAFSFTLGEGNALPLDDSLNGVTYRHAAFTIYPSTTATATAAFTFDKTNSADLEIQDNSQATGKKFTIKQLVTTWSDSKVVDGQVTVSVYKLSDDGATHTPVPMYNSQNEPVTSVLFHANSYTIKDWHFTPGTAGDYQMVVTAKENASATSYTRIYTFNVTQSENFEGNFSSSSVAPAAAVSQNATTTVGSTITLPNYDVVGSTNYYGKNRLLYTANDYTDAHKYGHYTITVKGVNDPDCVIGNKFTPNYAGTYKFEYNAYPTDMNTLFSTKIYKVTVTANSDDHAIMKMNEDYYNQSTADVITEGTGDDAKKAVVLKEFILANNGGAKDFTISKALLNSNLTKVSDTVYNYPLIAVPMPNVLEGQFTTDDVKVTVQKSGATDFLVSSKEKDVNKASKEGKVNGYFVFRPTGKLDAAGNALTGSENEASAVYVVTYTLPNGQNIVYNLTVGNPKIGNLEFDLDGFLTYQKKNKTVNIDNENNTPVIDPVKDPDDENKSKRYVTIDMKKVMYDTNDANEDFLALIQKGVTGDESATVEQKMQHYIWENATVTVSHNGTAFIYSSDLKSGNIGSKNDTDMTYTFDLSKGSGTYKIDISLRNPYVSGGYARQSFEFSIDATATNKNINLNNVWGIILIVLSVGLLAGVIFYFVKTARETKFLDAPKQPKKDKKAKKDKNAPQAPAAEQEGK